MITEATTIEKLDRLVRLADAMTRDPDARKRFTKAYGEYLTEKAMAAHPPKDKP